MRPAGVCKTLVTVMDDFLTDHRAALLDHDHGAVFQIADALADLIARLDDANASSTRRAGPPT